jgi:hypothetical protein
MTILSRKSLVAAAVAAALTSSAAFAVAPSAAGPQVTFYAGGGSAQANAFYVAACKLFGNNMDVYTDDPGGALSGDYYVMYGTSTVAIGTVPSNTNIAYIYKFNGGSFTNGVAPQTTSVTPTQLPYPTIGNTATTNTILSLAVPTSQTQGTACTNGGLPTYKYVPTNIATPNQAPDFGLADVEVPMFRNFNNPTGNAGKTAKNTDGGAAPSVGNPTGIYDNLFGVAVTANVYALKTNFTRAEVAGILAGTITDFSQLYGDNGAALPAGGIIFLDRGEGSGTKASGNEYFLGYPGDSPGATTPNSAAANYCGVSLAACSPSNTQVHADIDEASTNTVISDLIAAQNGGLMAVAVLGMENPPGKNLNGGSVALYDFVKINGVAVDSNTAPGDSINAVGAGAGTSYSNAVKGDYDFYYQNSFQSIAAAGTQAAANAAAFKAQMTVASFVGGNSGLSFPAALPGTLLDADKATALVKGVTLNSRSQKSTGPLLPFFDATFGAIPATFDPI